MLQKLITVGNSKAITISSRILKELGNVDTAKVEFVPSKKRLIIDFDTPETVSDVVDPEVYVVAKRLKTRYHDAFEELARR